MSTTTITRAVQDQYAAAALSLLTNRTAGVQAVAEAFGYSAEELTSIPAEANMGLSCGNPTATAHLRPGEVVVDLGCGGGLDVFLAAQKVGPTGRAIGIDMTPEMIQRARNAAKQGVNGQPITNVEFHLAQIDNLPLKDASCDVVVSNCVINLAPDKGKVFAEMFRILKPGGRVAVSDIALKQPLPDELKHDVMAYVGCIAGAVLVGEYESGLKAAGFDNVVIVDAKSDLNAYAKVEGQSMCCSPGPIEPAPAGLSTKNSKLSVAPASCCAPSPTGHDDKSPIHSHLSSLMRKYDINAYAASVKVFAVKPDASTQGVF